MYRIAVGLTITIVCLAASPASAKDHFLAIGGGYSPAGNQVSLEKNIQLFQTVVKESHGPDTPVTVFYSDGKNPTRDVQFLDPTYEPPQANLYLARLYKQSSGLKNQYRDHQIADIRDGASRGTVQQWFNETGKNLSKDDRLFIYVTTHGGRTNDKKKPHNTNFYMWNYQNFRVNEFVEELDKIAPEVPVILVMVQCYAGGFAHSIFDEGLIDKGLSKASRCGFFATVHDRVAAGCTPDINEENYQEYSSHFWAALRGKSRTGTPIQQPDYDKDGKTSFAEAHAYALLTSETIDISVKTSDALLRAYSKTELKDDKKKDEGEKGDSEQQPLMTSESPFAELARDAAPYELAVMEGLSSELKLDAENRAKAARELADKLSKEKKKIDEQRNKKRAELEKIRKELKNSLHTRWPELHNRWSPAVTQLLLNEADQVVEVFESHGKFSDFMRLYDEIESLGEEKLDIDRRWVKCQRLVRTLENVALAANLPRFASEEILAKYAELLEDENGSLGPNETAESPPAAEQASTEP